MWMKFVLKNLAIPGEWKQVIISESLPNPIPSAAHFLSTELPAPHSDLLHSLLNTSYVQYRQLLAALRITCHLALSPRAGNTRERYRGQRPLLDKQISETCSHPSNTCSCPLPTHTACVKIMLPENIFVISEIRVFRLDCLAFYKICRTR